MLAIIGGMPRTAAPTLLLAASIVGLLAFGAEPPPASLVVTFDGGASGNIGGWTYGLPPTYPSTGGNPTWYLRTSGLDTFAPQLRTTGQSVFTGNYYALRMARLGVDVNTFAVDFSAAERPLSLILVSNNQTPGNPNDDWGAYFLGPDIPVPGDGWQSFTYDIPYWVTGAAMPAGWTGIQFGGSSPAPNWGTLITDVDQVVFFYGNPEFFFIFQMWTVGADNIQYLRRIADLNGDGVVDGNDLAILLGSWGPCPGCPADFNHDGVVDGSDLAVLLGSWT